MVVCPLMQVEDFCCMPLCTFKESKLSWVDEFTGTKVLSFLIFFSEVGQYVLIIYCYSEVFHFLRQLFFVQPL